MPTTKVDVQDLLVRVDELLTLADAGNEIVITQNSVPRARLTPIPTGQRRIPGLHPGAIELSDDFDSPLPDSFWLGNP